MSLRKLYMDCANFKGMQRQRQAVLHGFFSGQGLFHRRAAHGSGISRRSDVLVEPIRAFNAAHGYGRSCPKQPRIMSAELFGDAGIIGAALLGKGK